MRMKNKYGYNVLKLIILDSLVRMRKRNSKSVSEKVERLGVYWSKF